LLYLTIISGNTITVKAHLFSALLFVIS